MKTLQQIAKKDKNNTVTKKDGSLKVRVGEAITYQVGNSTTIHHSYYTGSGRHIRLVTYRDELINLLVLSGYTFTEGNDAPKGGKQGGYIKISKMALAFLKAL